MKGPITIEVSGARAAGKTTVIAIILKALASHGISKPTIRAVVGDGKPFGGLPEDIIDRVVQDLDDAPLLLDMDITIIEKIESEQP